MKILVVGGSAGTGLATVDALLGRGHTVTAFSRHASAMTERPGDLRRVDGDATDVAAVGAVVPGHDAVVVTLGISEPAVRVRLRGARGTADDVRSRGTSVVVDAMLRSGVRRLVTQSSFGVGETRDLLPLASRLVFALLLKPQIADTERQEEVVRASGLDWTLVQPVNLTDDPAGNSLVSTDGSHAGIRVPRRAVAEVLADLATSAEHVGRSVAVSGR
ncbi:MAG: NAD(P)-dependent oxidoreductase [Microbacterium sp.]|nr:MAG: NAD(P)-dependent oxidoreductase [Microbacterium sp.]